jgi:hypothetical protein
LGVVWADFGGKWQKSGVFNYNSDLLFSNWISGILGIVYRKALTGM